MKVNRGVTAMARSDLSRPVRIARESDLIVEGTSFFDFGCGRGGDVERLRAAGIVADGWDPYYAPEAPKLQADVVNLGFVVNVVENVTERRAILEEAWSLTKRALLVSARLEHERDDAHFRRHGDGWITSKRSFQRFFTQEELGAWVGSVLGADPVPAALGTFVVFRNESDRQLFEDARVRMPRPGISREEIERTYTEYPDLVDEVGEFVALRGRMALPNEHGPSDRLADVLGTRRRCGRVVRGIYGEDWWSEVQLRRRKDLIVFLALEKFGGRRVSSAGMAPPLRADIRALFGSFSSGQAQADTLLESCGDLRARELAMRVSTVGKLTPNALYVHVDSLDAAPVLLRLYATCAMQLTGAVDANVIKLWRGNPGVSFLTYPGFERIAHPTLAEAIAVDLRDRTVRVHEFSQRSNRPLLHRKEEFISKDHRLYERFSRLTRAEERAGLYRDPSRIGLEHGWSEALRQCGVEIRGHSVRRSTAERGLDPRSGEWT